MKHLKWHNKRVIPCVIIRKKEERLSKEYIIKLDKLPEEVRKEVIEYIKLLLEMYDKKTKIKRKLTFNWEGGLKEEKISSVDLQHRALKWR